jgi:hypothetical protein
MMIGERAVLSLDAASPSTNGYDPYVQLAISSDNQLI